MRTLSVLALTVGTFLGGVSAAQAQTVLRSGAPGGGSDGGGRAAGTITMVDAVAGTLAFASGERFVVLNPRDLDNHTVGQTITVQVQAPGTYPTPRPRCGPNAKCIDPLASGVSIGNGFVAGGISVGNGSVAGGINVGNGLVAGGTNVGSGRITGKVLGLDTRSRLISIENNGVYRVRDPSTLSQFKIGQDATLQLGTSNGGGG